MKENTNEDEATITTFSTTDEPLVIDGTKIEFTEPVSAPYLSIINEEGLAYSDNTSILKEELEDDIDFNTVPENPTEEVSELDPIIVQRHELATGISPSDLKDLVSYMNGTGAKPIFIDRYTSDAEGRFKDMIMACSQVQMQRVPLLTALQGQVQERLFSPENLYDMDSQTLSATMNNLSKEINGIINTSVNALQITSQFGTLNSEYRRILDRMMMLPEDNLNKIKELLFSDDEQK